MISGYHHFRKPPYSHKHIMVPTILLFRSDRLGPGILLFKKRWSSSKFGRPRVYNLITAPGTQMNPWFLLEKTLLFFLTIPKNPGHVFFFRPLLGDPRWVTCSCHLQTSKICSFQSSASPVPQDKEPNGFHLPQKRVGRWKPRGSFSNVESRG